MTLLILVGVLTVLISGICSLFEATLYSTRIGVLEAEKSGKKRPRLASRFAEMKSEIARPASAILVLNTVANTAGATVCGMLATTVLGRQWVLPFSILLTVLILFFGEILPKTLGATHWRGIWHRIVWPLAVMQRGLSPVIWITQWFASLFSSSQEGPVVTEDEIQASIKLGGKAGELSRSEMRLLNAVFRFDDILTRQVMVPRREVVFLDARWPLEKGFEVARQSRHTRFPLCEGSLDSVVGLVHIKDLVGVASDLSVDLRSVSRPLRHIPETLPISRLLRQMQRSHQHMALVDDEYGAVVGIVTMENVVEQIVGSVQDEFDSELPEIVTEGKGVYRVGGQVPLERINRELGLDLESDDVDSLSGLLVSRLSRLAQANDRVRLQGAVARVIEAQDGRATQVRIRLTGQVRAGTGPANGINLG